MRQTLTVTVAPRVRERIDDLAAAQRVSRSMLVDRILAAWLAGCDSDLAAAACLPPPTDVPDARA